MNRRWFERLFIRAVGMMLCLAALPKLHHPDSFYKALQGYRLFPQWTLSPLTYGVPALEMAVGLSLILWLSRWGLVWALFLFGSFTAALSWARWHHYTLTCGCFGRIDSWLHRLPHGLALHILTTLVITVGLAVLVRSNFRRQPDR